METPLTATASDSSSSAASRTERPGVDLRSASLLPPLPSAFLAGDDRDLLEPLAFLAGEEAPPAAPPATDRRELASALAVANAAYGHPAGDALAGKLADPATRVVVTGQQPGLFGGPIYALSKAVAAALWAERLEAAGEPAAAVFWVSTEDHDFREVSRAVFATAGGPLALDLGEDPSPLMPVGMRTFGPALGGVLERLRESNPGERWAGWATRLAEIYRPDVRFGEAFCRLMVELLGERCPLLLDASLPAVKAAERPWLRRIVELRSELEAASAERDERIAGRGHELQVKPQPGASPLFVVHGRERRRVEWREGDRFALRGEDGFEEGVDWLLAAIDENPAVVSPGVLARAAVQDAILGTSILVFGPGEVSYAPQVAPLYDLLGLAPPAVFLRPQALVLGGHQLDKLAGLELSLDELVAADLDLDRALAGGREEDLVAPARAGMEELLERLKDGALRIDPNLEGPWRKTRGQIERALEAFAGRAASAVARRGELARSRAEDLRSACRPLGALQERVLSAAHFPGKYGERFVEAFFEQLALDPRRLQVICPG